MVVGGGGDGGGGPHGTVAGWERDIRWWEATCLRYPNVLSAHVTRSPTQGGGPAISNQSMWSCTNHRLARTVNLSVT